MFNIEGLQSAAKTASLIGLLFVIIILSISRANALFIDSEQHENTITIPPSGSNSATYRIQNSLMIQKNDANEKPHPYTNPNPDRFHHHHAPKPESFAFNQAFFIPDTGDIGSEATILAGSPRQLTAEPYTTTLYDLLFFVEDNAEFVLDDMNPWTGILSLPSEDGGSTGFSFGVSVLGTGGQFGLSWDNATPDISMTWTGSEVRPRFSFLYGETDTLKGGSLTINGFVKTKGLADQFGNVNTAGSTTLVEDRTLLGDKERARLITPQVYDVVHDLVSVPEPPVWIIFASGLLIMFGWSFMGRAFSWKILIWTPPFARPDRQRHRFSTE